jgi:hypothetical protein
MEIYCCGADNIENTSIIEDVFILGDCPATNRNIRYNNGLPIFVMQYQGKVFTKLLPSNALIHHNTYYITITLYNNTIIPIYNTC